MEKEREGLSLINKDELSDKDIIKHFRGLLSDNNYSHNAYSDNEIRDTYYLLMESEYFISYDEISAADIYNALSDLYPDKIHFLSDDDWADISESAYYELNSDDEYYKESYNFICTELAGLISDELEIPYEVIFKHGLNIKLVINVEYADIYGKYNNRDYTFYAIDADLCYYDIAHFIIKGITDDNDFIIRLNKTSLELSKDTHDIRNKKYKISLSLLSDNDYMNIEYHASYDDRELRHVR